MNIGVIGTGDIDFEKQLLAMTPLGRIAQPSDIAPIAVFLASDEASWLTGEIILAFGGRVRHPRLAALPGPQQLGPKNESAGVASGSRRLT